MQASMQRTLEREREGQIHKETETTRPVVFVTTPFYWSHYKSLDTIDNSTCFIHPRLYIKRHALLIQAPISVSSLQHPLFVVKREDGGRLTSLRESEASHSCTGTAILLCRVPHSFQNCTQHGNQQTCLPNLQERHCVGFVGPLCIFSGEVRQCLSLHAVESSKTLYSDVFILVFGFPQKRQATSYLIFAVSVLSSSTMWVSRYKVLSTWAEY